MTEKEIQRIVEEVIRRIRLMEQKEAASASQAAIGKDTLMPKILLLEKQIQELKHSAESCGERKAIENKAEEYRVHKHRIDKRVIAKQDLKDILQGELEIRQDAVLTTTAKDLIVRRGIRLIRFIV